MDKLFSECELRPELLRGVAAMGFTNMTPVQEEAIPAMLRGADIIAQAQTGTGKTAAFGLPILQQVDPENKSLQIIILCPTRELAMQSAGELRNMAAFMHDVKVLPVYGGQDITRQIQGLKGTQIVVGTPGRVMDHMRRHTIRMDSIATVILDEADEMMDMGFLEDMETILGAVDHPHQTCMFSATMPDAILALTDQFLTDPEIIRITKDELTISSVDQYYYGVKREYKVQALCRIIAFHSYRKCIIFCNKKSSVDELAAQLRKEGCTAEALHGDLSQFQRDAVMKRFRENERCILIATDIAARGIDVENVDAVFNYDIPQEAEYYVHRIGRTGRAGRNGVSHTLCESREFRKIRFIEKLCNTTITEKTVPTPAEIHASKVSASLNRSLEVIRSEGCGNTAASVRDFCLANGVCPEELAAAFLRLDIGEDPEELDIDLPGREEAGRDRRHRHDSLGRRRDFDHRDESGRRKNSRTEASGLPYVFESEIPKKKGRSSGKADKSFPDRSERKKNAERSRQVLMAAVRDVDRKGRPVYKKNRKKG